MKLYNLDNFINMTKKEIKEYFISFSKEELFDFANKNNIPYKKSCSKNKMLNYLYDR